MRIRAWLFLRTCLLFVPLATANMPIQGKTTQEIELLPKTTNGENTAQLLGYPQAALNQTKIELTFTCAEDIDFEFSVQYVIRSSPCDKEFFDPRGLASRLKFYFWNDDKIPAEYSYNTIVFYRSGVLKMNCKDHSMVFSEGSPKTMQLKNVTSSRTKREAILESNSLTTFHPMQEVPIDGVYLLIVEIVNGNARGMNITCTAEWRQPHGFLSAVDFPLYRFYFIMCIVYMFLAFGWLYMCVRYYKDILRIQIWIGAVIVLGMIEKAFFYAEYASVNENGDSTEGLLQVAELMSCLKRTMSRILVIIVSVGYGVVKPRLGQTLTQVILVGCVYFTFCALEGLARVSKNQMQSAKQQHFASLPLVLTDISIFYWIFISLANTTRTLKMKRNEVKLAVYRHFMNTLLIAVVASVIFMMWSIYEHKFVLCLTDWKELWVDTAFWHVFFCSILVVIMILWRPSVNNQRYAFTPLLDDSEDENDFDEIFNQSQAPGFEAIMMRNTESAGEMRKNKETAVKDAKLQEDLKWIEDNIPTSITDHLLADEEEDRQARELERSKMR